MSRAAIWSGVLGATASCAAKFAFDPQSSIAAYAQRAVCSSSFVQSLDVHFLLTNTTADASADSNTICGWIVGGIIARGLCFVAMIACNAYMLGFFLKGMEESGSVAGTALSTASNFMASAAFGYVVWGERFTVVWWTGFGMVTAGVLLLVSANQRDKTKNNAEEINKKVE